MKTQMLDTSLKAYDNLRPALNRKEQNVMALFTDPHIELSNQEIAARLEWSINRVTGRVKSLRDKGYLMDRRKRVDAITGSMVHAWGLENRILPAQMKFFE